MTYCVTLVLRASTPAQVLYPIVGCVSISVQSLHPLRARSYERLQNQTVDFRHELAPVVSTHRHD